MNHAISFVTILITLFLVMDPLGNIPLFLAILKKYDSNVQNKIIIRETIVAFFILLAFLYGGRYILQGMGVTLPALSIAGAIILFIIALHMMFPGINKGLDDDGEDVDQPFIVPLAIPLTAGPSAITVILLYAANENVSNNALLSALVINCVVFALIMLGARYLMRFLGKRFLIALERLMGMILTTLAIQMLLSGISQYLSAG